MPGGRVLDRCENSALDFTNMVQAASSLRDPGAKAKLRLLSYNIQAGIGSSRYHHYLTHSWRHVLPHARRLDNLDHIARVIGDFDVVAMQETDAGSLRSHFVNQAEYLARKAKFPFWYHQVNRNMGRLGQYGNSVLSRFRPHEVADHRLPGLIPGRGAMAVRFGTTDAALALFVIHLALGRRARLNQLAYLSDLANEYEHVVLMGDMNCQPGSAEMEILFRRTNLLEPEEEVRTFPSWRPYRKIDHILVTPSLMVDSAWVLNHAHSDHLPVAMEITVPDGVQLAG